MPSNVKQDGTLCIAKDATIVSETFIVVNPEPDADGTFEYINTDGEHRHMPIIKMSDGSIGYVFELEKGTYQMWRNHLTIIIDDVLHRDERSGGIEELTPTRFALYEKLEARHKITAKYYRIMRIGNPYPRFFISDQVPESAGYGDFWLDYDATMQEYDILTEDGPSDTTTVSYNNVTGKPTTLNGYGITNKVATKYHTHTQDDFIDIWLGLYQQYLCPERIRCCSRRSLHRYRRRRRHRQILFGWQQSYAKWLCTSQSLRVKTFLCKRKAAEKAASFYISIRYP